MIGAAVVFMLGAAVALGGTGSTAGDGSERGVESVPTGTDRDGGTTAVTAETAEPKPDPAFDFTVDRIEECGRTCRDVTSTLTNDGAAATDVTVHTRIYAGNGTDGDVVWEGRERVGTLEDGESYTTTERVGLSLADGVVIRSAGGWITVRTTIRADEKTVTTTRRRRVS